MCRLELDRVSVCLVQRQGDPARDAHDGLERSPVVHLESQRADRHWQHDFQLFSRRLGIHERLPDDIVRDLERRDSRPATNARRDLLLGPGESARYAGPSFQGRTRTAFGASMRSLTPTPARMMVEVRSMMSSSSSRGGILATVTRSAASWCGGLVGGVSSRPVVVEWLRRESVAE